MILEGKAFEPVARLTHDVSQKESGSIIHAFSENFDRFRARYIRAHAKNVGRCPPWHPGAGGKAWIFADEITVQTR